MCFSNKILIGDCIDLFYSNSESKLKIYTGQLHSSVRVALKCMNNCTIYPSRAKKCI